MISDDPGTLVIVVIATVLVLSAAAMIAIGAPVAVSTATLFPIAPLQTRILGDTAGRVRASSTTAERASRVVPQSNAHSAVAETVRRLRLVKPITTSINLELRRMRSESPTMLFVGLLISTQHATGEISFL